MGPGDLVGVVELGARSGGVGRDGEAGPVGDEAVDIVVVVVVVAVAARAASTHRELLLVVALDHHPGHLGRVRLDEPAPRVPAGLEAVGVREVADVEDVARGRRFFFFAVAAAAAAEDPVVVDEVGDGPHPLQRRRRVLRLAQVAHDGDPVRQRPRVGAGRS